MDGHATCWFYYWLLQISDDEDNWFEEFLSDNKNIKDKKTNLSFYNALINWLLWEKYNNNDG